MSIVFVKFHVFLQNHNILNGHNCLLIMLVLFVIIIFGFQSPQEESYFTDRTCQGIYGL